MLYGFSLLSVSSCSFVGMRPRLAHGWPVTLVLVLAFLSGTAAAARITNIMPRMGGYAGGTEVTITGHGFANGAESMEGGAIRV